MAEVAKGGDPRVAAAAIAVASLSNTIVKCGMAVVSAGLAFAKPLIAATAALIPVGLAAAFLF
jgi:uncharacterized membrane protein (DUF4010 family)